MSKPKEKYPVINEKIYWEKVRKNEHYTGYVQYNDGTLSFVLSEVVVSSRSSDLNHSRYTHYALKTAVKYTERSVPGIKLVGDALKFDNSPNEMKLKNRMEQGLFDFNMDQLFLSAIEKHLQQEEYRDLKEKRLSAFSIGSPSQIKIDVSNPRTQRQKEYSKIRQKVRDGSIRAEDVPICRFNSAKKEIAYYFYMQHLKENPYLNPKHEDYNEMVMAVINTGLSYGEMKLFNEKTWLNIRNMKIYKQGFYGNQYMNEQMVKGLKAESLKASKSLGRLSKGLSYFNMGAVGFQYFNDEINTGQFFAEETSSLISLRLPWLYGLAWEVGWESGRFISQTESYQDFVYYYFLPWRREHFGY